MPKIMSLDAFLILARNIHGDKYDYSKVVYKHSGAEITLTCKEHGEFQQRPKNHLAGAGCNKCRYSKIRVTQSEFISRSKEIHGDKYDYSLSQYRNSNSYVTITCKKHGSFQQRASTHLSGSGCQQCGRLKSCIKETRTQEEFLRQVKIIHGDKYDYSFAIYVSSLHDVCIVCKHHGMFKQNAAHHLEGSGCPKCRNERKNETRTQEFIRRAKEIHGDKYDYSIAEAQTSYKNLSFTIVCPLHGSFLKTTMKHLLGEGCPEC